ncbi:MAG TPA: efflux transporter periplasmic adaptor subunit [Holosporales bacterium]|nr:efflux transporter periplasmic adaptor subunit [Holosporales bacterium]
MPEKFTNYLNTFVINLIKFFTVHARVTLFFLGILVSSLGFFFFVKLSNPPVNNAPYSVPVSVFSVQKKSINFYEELPARAVPYLVAEIRPQVTGIIIDKLFEEGSYIEKGQPLYQIDANLYLAKYNSAIADLTKKKSTLTTITAKASRYSKAVKIGGISKQNYDDILAELSAAKADVGIAEAALETAKINLSYTKMLSPVTGWIGKSEVTKGALVTANQEKAIARVTQLDPIYVDILQQSDDQNNSIRFLKDEQKLNAVTLLLANQDSPYNHKGTIQFTDTTVDPSTNSILLRIIFPNPDKILLPGLFVRAKMKTLTIEGIPVPQRSTIINADGSKKVWVIDKDNKAIPRTIIAKKMIEDSWVVESGLESGEDIVYEGIQKLKPNITVTPSRFQESGRSDASFMKQDQS